MSVIVLIIVLILIKKKSMQLDIRFEKMIKYCSHFFYFLCSKLADDVKVAPNMGYGLVNIAKASAAQYVKHYMHLKLFKDSNFLMIEMKMKPMRE